MKPRCGRPVTSESGGAECGLPLYPSSKWGYGRHQPHRYIENNWRARVKHEWALRKNGYTNWGDLLLAVFARRARVVSR